MGSSEGALYFETRYYGLAVGRITRYPLLRRWQIKGLAVGLVRRYS